MSGLILQNIDKSFDDKAILKDISLSVADGDFISLLGPSGCGKTTILNIIAGLLYPDRGSVHFNEQDMTRTAVEKRGISLVDQDILLFPHMTVTANIAYGLKLRKESLSSRLKRVKELLNLIHMEGFGNRYPHELSGGQQQRVAIARALAVNPRVLLLDEPFSKLDITLRESMRLFVKEIHEKVGTTTIMVTHDIQDTLTMSDKICILMDGMICQIGSPRDVFQRPVSKKLAEFLGFRNFLSGRFDGNMFQSPLGPLPFSDKRDIKESATVLIRPESLRILPYTGKEGSFRGIIRELSFAGGLSHFKVQIEDTLLHGSCIQYPDAAPGDEVYIEIDHRGMVLLEKEN